MKKIALLFSLVCCLSTATAVGSPAKYDQALVNEINAFVKTTDSVLKSAQGVGALKVVSDHSSWALDIVKRAEIFLGTVSALERSSSPYIACYKSAYWAREMWSDAMKYSEHPTKATYDSKARLTKMFRDEMNACKAAKP